MSKDTIVVHIVDIKDDTIARNLSGSEFVGDAHHRLLIGITPAALLMTQRPHRWKFRPPRQHSERAHQIRQASRSHTVELPAATGEKLYRSFLIKIDVQ